MRFSVVIPAYNCAGTLEGTVDSIRASGLTDLEIILIDDGSTDGTAEVCDGLAGRFPEVRCVHQSNEGVSAARNRGIDESEGEYIWFVDSDDTVDVGALARASGIVSARKPDMLIFGLSFDYYHRGKMYRRDELVYPHERLMSDDDAVHDFGALYECNALTPVWNKLYRRETVVSSGVRFREGMILMEDFLFVLELLPFCRGIYCLPEVIYRYRQSEDERGAYRRLRRIPDLAAYLEPFDESMRKLALPDRDERMAEFYRMLLWQKMYYASSPQEIRHVIDVHKRGKYAGVPCETAPFKIYLRNLVSRLRHRLAVEVKTARCAERKR